MPCQASADFADGQIFTVHDNILMGRPFSLETLEFTGPARPVCDDVLSLPAAHLSVMSATDSGVLAYASGGGGFGNSRLYRIDRDGGNSEPVGDPLMTWGNRVSPDGSLVALAMPDQQAGTFDIWILEMERNLLTRLTFEPETELGPIWSPDGKQVAFSGDGSGRNNIYLKPLSGAGASELLFSSNADCYPSDWSADGTMISYTEIDSSGSTSIGLFTFGPDGGPKKYRENTFDQGAAMFSPDGLWLAYWSNETGTYETFVESVAPGGGRWRVSSEGGSYPSWSIAGDRLYFLNNNGDLMAAEISISESGIRFGRTNTITQGLEILNVASYSENRADGSLLVLKTAQNRGNSQLSLITGWQGLVEKNQSN
jgi:Tol biopolymer transport system component